MGEGAVTRRAPVLPRSAGLEEPQPNKGSVWRRLIRLGMRATIAILVRMAITVPLYLVYTSANPIRICPGRACGRRSEASMEEPRDDCQGELLRIAEAITRVYCGQQYIRPEEAAGSSRRLRVPGRDTGACGQHAIT